MPFMGEIHISSPNPDANDASQLTHAVASAVEAGWQAPRVVDDDIDSEIAEESQGSILDYRVFGYPGGVIVVVVLEGGGLEQSALALAALARHLTTWSPGLLDYSIDEIKLSKLDKPYDDDNWLPPLVDEEPVRRWPLEELLDKELQSLSALYLLACAVRSLWDPTRGCRPTTDAQDIVTGAVQDPWGRELMSALSPLLISAARFEANTSKRAKLIIRGAGDTELAADLLRRARETGHETATEGWTDDRMRGHVLMERFMEDHVLGWNRVLSDEPPEQAERRSNRQLRQLLWAGLRALATLAYSLTHVSGPWQLLEALTDDEVISILADAEAERIEDADDRDFDEIHNAAGSHTLVWLAIRRPELLDTEESRQLVGATAQDVSSFHQVVYQALLMAGTESVRAALGDPRISSRIKPYMLDFVNAMAMTDHDGDSIQGERVADPYDDMHHALEAALAKNRDLISRMLDVLILVSISADLTQTEINTRRGVDGYISTPRELAAEMLTRPAEHAAIILSDDSDDEDIVRLTTLALMAQIDPVAAGEMAAESPDLTGDDPRIEPAACSRARRWVEESRQVAQRFGLCSAAGSSRDAQAILDIVSAGAEIPNDWPIQRVVAAAAEAAASVLRNASALDRAEEIFTR